MIYLTFLAYSLGAIYVTTGSTTSPPLTTTPRITTVPGVCFWEGKWYNDGEEVYSAPDGCYGGYCESGSVQNWDHECYFYTPECYGHLLKLDDQCCPVCLNTTTPPPTTTPQVPPGGCVIDDQIYAEDEEISRAPDNCYGTFCSDGHVVTWDHECFFHTPFCSGEEVKLPDQCCPLCLTANTTTPPPPTTSSTTSTISTGTLSDVISATPSFNDSTDCLMNGQLFEEGTRTSTDPCEPCFCLDGQERCLSRKECRGVHDCSRAYIPQGQCCPVCGTGISGSMGLISSFQTLCLLLMLSFTKILFSNT